LYQRPPPHLLRLRQRLLIIPGCLQRKRQKQNPPSKKPTFTIFARKDRFMPLICVCSPKGGVGKTTLTANLAYALARSGSKVLALDFDVQNALRLHFGVPLSDERGYVAKSAESSDWSQFVLTAGGNIFVLPYGEASEDQRLVFEERLTNDEHFLIRGLNTLLNYPGLIIVADFPPGPLLH
jgi:cellulose biosynthesis protein BcsQ